MRILLDTNIWLSYLLARSDQNIIRRLVGAYIGVERVLIVPPELINELRQSVAKSAHLRSRITREEVEALVQEFSAIAYIPPPLQADFPRYSRDAQDDYLLGHGLVHQADYLVSGDKDLLVLGAIETLQIVAPAKMKLILTQQGWWQ
jgi:uncharacterized protein